MNHQIACVAAAFFLAVGAISTARAADWIDLRDIAPIHGDANAGAAKATTCVACHGPNGNAIVPVFPRLAGQRADYMYWRLVAFKRDPQSPMAALVANLSDADMRDLATYFAAQASTAGATAAAATPARGEALFLHGDPARGAPPCQGCHGADAAGPADTRRGTWPSLRGQHAAYVTARLKAYRDGKPGDTSNAFVMEGVARGLDDASIDAIAAWLGALPSSDAH